MLQIKSLKSIEEEKIEDLHNAARYGNLEKVKILINAGVDVNAKDDDEETALLFSVDRSHLEIMKELIAAGADVNVKEENGKTPLHHGADKCRLDMVELLIAAGADVNAKEDDGWTPLHYNAYSYNGEITKALVAAGAEVNATDDSEKTPLHHGAEKGYLDVVEALIESGADVNAMDEDEKTALHYSAHQGHSEIVRALIIAGADNSIEDNHERTAWDLSSSEMKMILMKCTLLYQYGTEWEPEMKSSDEVLHKFWNACRNEVEKMTETWLGDSGVTFLKFMTETDQNKLAFYISEKTFGVVNELGRTSFLKMFPTYAEDIEIQFQVGSYRANLLNKSQELMTRCFYCTLPIEITRKISEYMTNDDLASFLLLKNIIC